MFLKSVYIYKLDSIQNQVARFILQIPKSASKVFGFVDAGLKPTHLQSQIGSRCLIFTWKVINGKRSSVLKNVLETVLINDQDSWTMQVVGLCGGQGIELMGKRLEFVRKTMFGGAITRVLNLMLERTSLMCMTLPVKWFKLQEHVNDFLVWRSMSF